MLGTEDSIFSIIGRQAARAQYARVVSSGGYRASDRPVAGGRADADLQVMLIGSGVSSGWGVATHQLALTGLLRDALQQRSGHQVRVELVGDELLDVRTAATWVGDRAGDGWDAVVVAIGVNDAARLTPLTVWERDYRVLIGHLRAGLPEGVPVVLAGLPPMSSIVPLRGITTRLVTSHAQRMNAIVQRIAHETASTICVLLPAKATEADRPWGSAHAYQPWADRLAPAVLATITDRAAPVVRRVRVPAPLTETLMDQAYGPGNRALQRLVDDAATSFGVGSARVKLVDGDRVFIAADSSRGAAKELPRSLTFCDVTVREGELQVQDVALDPRFAGNPLLQLAGLTSYAGVAVRGRDGVPVGTVCLFNGAASAGVDMDALRALARKVEAELAEPTRVTTPVAAATTQPPLRRRGVRSRVLGYAHLRLQGPRFAREARQGRAAPAETGPVHVYGPNPIRVLVYGGEYAVGFGAPTRQLALDGAIADALHRHTGHGVIVHNRSDDRWHLHELADQLGSTGAHLYDLVIWAPPFAEAARYTTLLPWRAGVTRMLTRIAETSDAGTVLLGIPPLIGTQPIAVMGRWRARQIEQVIRQITERTPKTLMVPSPPVAMHELGSTSGPRVYADTATAALPAMLELLNIRNLTNRPTPRQTSNSRGSTLIGA